MTDERQKQMRARTKRFALAIVSLFVALPKSTVAQVLGRQVLRSGTSVGAHYREACRAKSDADFVRKIEGALQELDEAAYWLELFAESKITSEGSVQVLLMEVDELMAIFVTVVKSLKSTGKPRAASFLMRHPSSLRRFGT